MKNKKAFSRLVNILLIIIIGFLVFSILSGGIKKSYSSVLEFIKEKAGLGKKDADNKEETDRVQKELLDNAKSVASNTKAIVQSCITQTQTYCSCGAIDFNKLGTYIIKLSNSNGKITLELLNPDLTPVVGETATLGNSKMRLDIMSSKEIEHILFSSSQIQYIHAGETNKVSNKVSFPTADMQKINVITMPLNQIAFSRVDKPSCGGTP